MKPEPVTKSPKSVSGLAHRSGSDSGPFGRIATMAQRYEMPFEKMLKELEKRNALDEINEEILSGKVLDFLISNASVKNEPAATAAAS